MITILMLIFLAQLLYYTIRDYNSIDWGKLSYTEKSIKFADLAYKGAWNTRYHWGTILQVFLIILINVLNIWFH